MGNSNNKASSSKEADNVGRQRSQKKGRDQSTKRADKEKESVTRRTSGNSKEKEERRNTASKKSVPATASPGQSNRRTTGESLKVKNDISNLDKMGPGPVGRKSSESSGTVRMPLKFTAAHIEIIRSGFENPHSDLGSRIYVRVFEKRRDFQAFFDSVGRDTWNLLGQGLTEFMDEVVANIENIEQVVATATNFGERHVDLRAHGFKPEIWVTMADAMTTECIYLDQAVHGQTEVLSAYSSLIAVLFGCMRDGYYDRLRRERRQSRRSSGKQD